MDSPKKIDGKIRQVKHALPVLETITLDSPGVAIAKMKNKNASPYIIAPQ